MGNDKKLNLIQRLFRRKKDNLINNIQKQNVSNKKQIIDFLRESKNNFYISSDFFSRYYNKYLRTYDDLKGKIIDYESMYKDPILSMALEFLVDDVTQYSNITKKRVWVISEIDELIELSNKLFNRVELQEKIWDITANTALYGNCFLRLYYKNEDFTGGIINFEIEKDIFRYIPIEVDGVIVKYIDRYANVLLEAFEVIVIKINMLNDYKMINNFYDIDISVLNSVNSKIRKKNTFEYGVSFFENCRRVWKQRLLVDDNVLLTRLENSAVIRLFKVNVENMSDEAGADLVNYYTDLLSYSNKIVDQAENLIRGSDTQITFGAKIILPVNGNEGLSVEEFGGNNEVSAISDLERLDKIFYASLRVPPEFLGLGESSGINIGENSLIRKEIRYARSCKKLQYAVINGLKKFCYYNFLSLGLDVNFEEDFEVVMNIISTAEEEEFKKSFSDSADVSRTFIEIINELKELFSNEEDFNEDDLISLLYYIVNNILNLNNIDLVNIFKGLLKKKKDKKMADEMMNNMSNNENEFGGGEEMGEFGNVGNAENIGNVENEENVENTENTENTENIGGEEEKTESRDFYMNFNYKIKKNINKEIIEKCKNRIINKLSRRYFEVYKISESNNADFIKDFLLKKEKKYFFESFENKKLVLNKDNLNKILTEYNKFDLNIFEDVNISDIELYLNDFEIIDKKIRNDVKIKDIKFCEFFINCRDIYDSNNGNTVLYYYNNNYYINYFNICRLFKNLINDYKFSYEILELKKK